MKEDLVYQIALENTEGIGPIAVKHLVGYCGSAKKVFETPKGKLIKIPGIGAKLASHLSQPNWERAKKVVERCTQLGIEIYPFNHPDYPKALKAIPDNPSLIFKQGSATLNPKKSVAIVGTRKATSYGKEVTAHIVSQLSEQDVCIISGFAYGIDITAHKAAMNEGLETIAIVAGGLDKLYPAAHKKYVDKILANGAFITEKMPSTVPDAHLFPARNRLIAGLADATIVIESSEKGGALITAHIADSYNKPVFAVPGNLTNTYSKGTNRLIASQKALLLNSVEDMIYYLHWDITHGTKKTTPPSNLESGEQVIFDLLSAENKSLHIDEIALKTPLSINEITVHLLGLEFKGLIKTLPGKNYGLVHFEQ